KNYFLGQVWYEPTVEAGNFDDSVFNEYEVYNLKLILKCIETLEQ
ncbi:MAG: YARHG domain-containing protein, partial [Clostridiales bacterium]|nr:YARHG domain-containing protein [Clostridiales bacterium]